MSHKAEARHTNHLCLAKKAFTVGKELPWVGLKPKLTTVSLPFHGHRYIFFTQELVCCSFLDFTHVRHGVVVYSQSGLNPVKFLAYVHGMLLVTLPNIMKVRYMHYLSKKKNRISMLSNPQFVFIVSSVQLATKLLWQKAFLRHKISLSMSGSVYSWQHNLLFNKYIY